jgi:single-stranded DNA-binding protein
MWAIVQPECGRWFAMLTLLASGTLAKDPQERATAAGKPYCTALVRVPCEDAEALLCSVIAFSPEPVQALLTLAKGDAVAIAGRASLRTWERDGEQHHGLSIVADQVLSVYQVEKRRRRSTNPEEAEHAA